MRNKKTIIIISAAILIITIAILIIWRLSQTTVTDNNQPGNPNQPAAPYVPQFMGQEEKAQLGISDELKIQVLTRGDKGEAAVYKIIKNDSEIITDPAAQLKTISPRQK